MKQTQNALRVANGIFKETGINVFEDSRKAKIVEMRQMYCTILYKNLDLTLYEIAELFNSQGKEFSHSAAYYNIMIYYSKTKDAKPELETLRFNVLSNISVYYEIVDKLKNTDDGQLKKILNLLNLW